LSVILVDLGDEGNDVIVSNAGWRETVEVLRPFGILDGERLHRLQTARPGERITQDEARAIGNALVSGPLSTVHWSGNVYPPAGHWRNALSGKMPYDPETYWPSWLRAFAAFCLTCNGFFLC
jgi:hypothetical protein